MVDQQQKKQQRKPAVDTPAAGRWCAAALLVTRSGRYLLQHRDDFAWIDFPDHWCCFGGAIEPGETASAALRRELREEIGYDAPSLVPFTDIRVVAPFATPRLDRVTFFTVPIRESDVSDLIIREGAEAGLLQPEELAAKPNVVPWDLTAVLMHARRKRLFRPAALAPPGWRG
jgi:8-oxo-dGTP pyrophosphatase MutT (NUDIX family)